MKWRSPIFARDIRPIDAVGFGKASLHPHRKDSQFDLFHHGCLRGCVTIFSLVVVGGGLGSLV
ncbi:hypothetical protein Poly41_34260 [Novipirellula artificiosorum]|uniref:Uncharacterized protein n=1 Tax=Novipirellula artificiosorum TaxID=2528016 RepID=A0A5C6DN62_9BACT|nr:hypothetical protein Poly41_34260 [Novipirellula artificiosorum]